MLRNVIKTHWLVVIPAFIMGLLLILPNIISISQTPNFSGIYPMFSGDETFYLTITKEVYDGHLYSGNPFLRVNKDSPAMQTLFFEILPTVEAKLLGLSVPEVFVLNDFLLPFLGVIILYILFFSLTSNKIISNLLSFLFYLIFLDTFNRPLSPQFYFIFLALGIFLIWKIISEKYNIKTFLILNFIFGVVFSILVYAYPFYWTAVLVLYALSSLTLVIKYKEFIYWFKGYITFGLTSLVLLLPYILNVLKAAKHQYFITASQRTGMVFTHYPGAFISVGFLFLCFGIVYLLRSEIKSKIEILFCYSIIVSGIILNWQNIITGRMLQFSSHYYLVTLLLVFVILSIVIKNLLPFHLESKDKKYKIFGAFLLGVILTVVIIYKQKVEITLGISHIVSPQDNSDLQHLGPAFEWFNENIVSDPVIYPLTDVIELVPIYTRGDNYSNGSAVQYLISDDEAENRWLIQHFWDPVDADYIRKSNNNILGNKFLDLYKHKEVRRKILELITRRKYPENILMSDTDVNRMLEKYSNFKKIGFEKSLKTYEVDYIILSLQNEKYKGLEKEFKKYSFLVPEVSTSDFIIYRVKS